MSIWHGISLGNEPRTTTNGTPYRREELRFDGRKAIAFIPDMVARGATTGLAVAAHGYGGYETAIDSGEMGDFAQAMVDIGWVVLSGYTGHVWGNAPAMKLIRSEHAWAQTRWDIDRVVLFGGSMGGLTVLNALGRDEVPDVVGAVAIVAVVDTQAMASSYQPSILAAYGATDLADLTVKQAGYDPARDDPARWSGKRLWLVQGERDTIVPPELHGGPFMARHPSPQDVSYSVGDHAHERGLDVGPVLSWLAPVPYDSSQVAPEPPEPVTPAGVVVRSTSGDVVSVRSTAGDLVPLA